MPVYLILSSVWLWLQPLECTFQVSDSPRRVHLNRRGTRVFRSTEAMGYSVRKRYGTRTAYARQEGGTHGMKTAHRTVHGCTAARQSTRQSASDSAVRNTRRTAPLSLQQVCVLDLGGHRTFTVTVLRDRACFSLLCVSQSPVEPSRTFVHPHCSFMQPGWPRSGVEDTDAATSTLHAKFSDVVRCYFVQNGWTPTVQARS